MSDTTAPPPDLSDSFRPILDQILEQSTLEETFVDRDCYRVNVATLWANVVSDPKRLGLDDATLEPVYALLDEEIARQIGAQETLLGCFEFVNTRQGEAAMNTLRLPPEHRDLLLFFASMMIDPEGHKRWTDTMREKLSKR